MNDDEISDRKNKLPKQVQKLENFSKIVHDIFECSESAMENRINDIMDMYRKINKLKERYSHCIDDEMRKREIKQQLFNGLKLRINLPKFSGYESKVDIYTFQSEFLKVHKRTTHTRIMLLLKRKLAEIGKMTNLRKIRDTEKIVEALNKMINTLKDLKK